MGETLATGRPVQTRVTVQTDPSRHTHTHTHTHKVHITHAHTHTHAHTVAHARTHTHTHTHTHTKHPSGKTLHSTQSSLCLLPQLLVLYSSQICCEGVTNTSTQTTTRGDSSQTPEKRNHSFKKQITVNVAVA